MLLHCAPWLCSEFTGERQSHAADHPGVQGCIGRGWHICNRRTDGAQSLGGDGRSSHDSLSAQRVYYVRINFQLHILLAWLMLLRFPSAVYYYVVMQQTLMMFDCYQARQCSAWRRVGVDQATWNASGRSSTPVAWYCKSASSLMNNIVWTLHFCRIHTKAIGYACLCFLKCFSAWEVEQDQAGGNPGRCRAGLPWSHDEHGSTQQDG